jgi:hypothetical protein
MYSGPTTDLYTSCPTSKVWVIYKKEVEKNSVLKITCNKFLLWKPRVCCDMNIWLFHFSSSEYKASTNRNMGTLLGKPEKHALWTLSHVVALAWLFWTHLNCPRHERLAGGCRAPTTAVWHHFRMIIRWEQMMRWRNTREANKLLSKETSTFWRTFLDSIHLFDRSPSVTITSCGLSVASFIDRNSKMQRISFIVFC